ncbi:hypothetical protein GALMADRAFT_145992 [Galerina marginata CBS 339.88]|uniref:F-box domain-containing protein n=1 Tax=Galerina marginata (strain CBS 339.88) TaxID=685588 RepID=A0A067SDM3_GALM3|nr:hypothetical protein GALMADRAFT_145992 [Galerina marginata CBS 339.88]
MAVHLSDLPAELLFSVASYLHFTDIYSLQRTCRSISQVIRSSSQLSYQIELEIAGMKDNPHCALPVTTRLDMLRARERAWASFEYSFLSSLEVPHKSSGLCDLTSGVYFMGKEDDDSVTRSVQALRLPHQVNSETEWDIIQFNANIIHCEASLENDILASVCLAPINDIPDMSRLCVILRRYSTHNLYDGIASPIILLSEEPTGREHPAVTIEISGENLAVIVLFMDDDSDGLLYVFNWKTGSRTQKLEPIRTVNTGLVFLREDILLHPHTNSNSLNIYHIPLSSSDPVCLIQKLQLPFLKPGFGISSIECYSDPSPTTNGSLSKNIPPRRPFGNTSEDAIVVFLLQISREDDDDDRDDDEPHASHLVLIVHRRALLELLPSDFASSNSVVPWKAWGPPVTRWLRVNYPIYWTILSAGQRFIDFFSSPGPDQSDEPDSVDILDFNPWHVKLAQARGSPDSKKATTTVIGGYLPSGHSTESLGLLPQEQEATCDTMHGHNGEPENPENVLPRGNAFANDVVSRLPYVRSSSTARWTNYDSVLIEEERLIGLGTRGTDDIRLLYAVDLLYFG